MSGKGHQSNERAAVLSVNGLNRWLGSPVCCLDILRFYTHQYSHIKGDWFAVASRMKKSIHGRSAFDRTWKLAEDGPKAFASESLPLVQPTEDLHECSNETWGEKVRFGYIKICILCGSSCVCMWSANQKKAFSLLSVNFLCLVGA